MPLHRRSFLSFLGAAAATPSLAFPQTAGDFAFEAGLAYLNTGAMGPTPQPVLDRVLAVSRILESDPTGQGYGPLQQQMEGVRAAAARFLSCAPAEIALTESTTAGMNAVAMGLGLKAGDCVLTSDQEHGGGRSAWKHLVRKHGVTLDEVVLPPLHFDADDIVKRFVARLTPQTRVLSVSHVTSFTGHVLPIARLAAALRSSNCLLVVDGAQAPGAIPVNLRALGCHAYVTSGHKWLLGPKGTGLLYINSAVAHQIEPVLLEGGPEAYTDATGVRNIPGMLGLGEAMRYHTDRDRARIEQHNMALRNHAYALLRAVPRLTVVSPPPGEAASPMVSFRLPENVDNHALQATLRTKYRISAKVFPREKLNGLRISTHLFNTEDHVGRAIAALRAELA